MPALAAKHCEELQRVLSLLAMAPELDYVDLNTPAELVTGTLFTTLLHFAVEPRLRLLVCNGCWQVVDPIKAIVHRRQYCSQPSQFGRVPWIGTALRRLIQHYNMKSFSDYPLLITGLDGAALPPISVLPIQHSRRCPMDDCTYVGLHVGKHIQRTHKGKASVEIGRAHV